MKGYCNKCGAEAEILAGHIGKKHKNCSGRKKGESKKDSGKWVKKEVK